jgi:hypothetical protein
LVTIPFKAVFEKVKESESGKVWKLKAIHATTTGNNRIYSAEELRLAARGLSGRPINIDHSEEMWLSYDYKNRFGPNSNSTIYMDYDPIQNCVIGSAWVTDKDVNEALESGKIQTVSIEQVPVKGESCSCSMVNKCTCEQHGVTFEAIAFLRTYLGVQPGDPNAMISKESLKTEEEETFKCSECGKEFDSKDALKAHYDAAHGDKKEADDEEPCKDGFRKDDEGKCVPDEDKEEESCPCALEKMLGKELFDELKRAEKFLETGIL